MLLEYQRPVPSDWAARLAGVTPPGGRISWLELVWESGDVVHGAVHRWVLYEVTPAEGVPWWKRDDLLETPVGSPGHQRILDRHLRDGCLMEPFWVIQGSAGGHKYRFSDSEVAMLELAGLPTEPPAPGALPFAQFDERVVRQVMKWDRLRKGYASLRAAGRQVEKSEAQAFRAELLRFLSDQVHRAVEETGVRITDNTIGLDDCSPVPDFEEIDRRWVETGVLT